MICGRGRPPRCASSNRDCTTSKLRTSTPPNHARAVQVASSRSSEITTIYFGGGPPEKFRFDGASRQPTDWTTGQPTHRRRLHRVRQHPGGLRRGQPHVADRLRADDVLARLAQADADVAHLTDSRRLTRQAEQPLAGQRQQDLLGAAGDGQAAGVEEVVHPVVGDDAGAVGQFHPELRERPAGNARRSACARWPAAPDRAPPTASWAMR